MESRKRGQYWLTHSSTGEVVFCFQAGECVKGCVNISSYERTSSLQRAMLHKNNSILGLYIHYLIFCYFN